MHLLTPVMSLFNLTLSWPVVAAQLLVLLVSWVVASKFLSPLRDIPGPTLASFSRLWHIIHIVRGDQNVELIALHDKLGRLQWTPSHSTPRGELADMIPTDW